MDHRLALRRLGKAIPGLEILYDAACMYKFFVIKPGKGSVIARIVFTNDPKDV